MSKTYDFNSYLAEARPTEFVLRVSDEQSITIQPPDVDTLLLLDEARSARRSLELLCGDQWSAVHALIGGRHSGVLERFLKDLKRHFNLEAEPQGGGRASSS